LRQNAIVRNGLTDHGLRNREILGASPRLL
jgi:hypothetical protein